ncbi:MAG: hypothetical protein ACO1OC_00060 [Tuberibacillus sp.]
MSISKETFDMTENQDLGGACFAPVIPLIRGKDIKVKQQVYSALLPGQKALFMFYAYYNHACKSLHEFYWWSAYYYAQPESWSAILHAMRYFKTDDMLRLLLDMEHFLADKNYSRSLDAFTATQKDLDDTELTVFIEAKYNKFHDIGPDTLNIIGECIRRHPNHFVNIVD